MEESLMFRSILLLSVIAMLFSCAKTEQEEIDSAVIEAKYHLNSMNCSKAQEVLDDIGFQDDDADYISVYASAQACYAGYKVLDVLFGGNLENIDSTNLIGSLTTFSTSNETEADSTAYTAIQNAITTLIESSGGSSPSTEDRNAKFGTQKSGDLSLQALYMIFVQMGKFFALHGNVNASGVKGGGDPTGNSCLFSYTTSDAIDWINDTTPGSCVAATGSEGSDLLESPETAADIKRRLCEGIILYNNMIDILSNISIPGSDQLGDVGDIQTALTTLMTAAEAAETGTYNDGPATSTNAISSLNSVTSQDVCEAEELDRIEKFYAIFFETIFQ